MSRQASQMKSLIIGCVIIYALGYASATTSFYWLRDEPPEQAYEQGYVEGYLYGSYQVTEIFDGRDNYADGLLDAWEYSMRDYLGDSVVDEFFAEKVDSTDTMPGTTTIGRCSLTMEVAPSSDIVTIIVDGDTLYFWKQQVDTGYVLKPLYRTHRIWTPEDSAADPTWKDWFDTSRGWYSWEISEALTQGWYDGVDSTYSMHEEAAYNWAMSVLLRERKYVIYFDSTEGCYMIQEVRGD